MVSRKNKKGRYSEPKSRSKEPWETRGKRKGNPRYMKVTIRSKKLGMVDRYVLRSRR